MKFVQVGLLGILVFAFTNLLVAPFSGAAERVALVIGNSNYGLAPLENPANDAAAMSARLRDLGFHVIAKQNLSRRGMTDALREMSDAVEKDGVALFFFAGHGMQVSGQNFLIPVNADIEEEFDVADESVSLDRVLGAMETSGSKLNIVFLDCCRNNPYKRGWRRSQEVGLAQTTVPEGTLISYAAAPGKEALDGRGQANSPFTSGLLNHLGLPGVNLNDSLMAVRRQVYESTNKEQRPWVSHDLLRPFVPKPAGAARPAMVVTAPVIPSRPTSVSPVIPGSPRNATKDRPFTNSLGMKFVPVPGTDTLFCIWETRVQDYAAYAAANSGVDDEWKDYEYKGHKQTPDHPVVNVSWEDATKFCEWLSKKDGVTYRLPTDHEWSVAVGIGDRESATASPIDKSREIEGIYPWGSNWPPPDRSGNYSSSEAKTAFDFTGIDGYDDGFAFTAPVGTYSANQLGVYDLGGNVWEWCQDWYSSDQKYRVLRGGSWYGGNPTNLLSSNRISNTPTNRYVNYGIRCVLVVGSGG